MIQSYLISLGNAEARRQSALATLTRAGFAYDLVEAVDGRDWPARPAPAFGRAITGGEQGCLASHKVALGQFLEGDAPLALILEDDVTWLDRDRILAVAEWLTPKADWDVAHLSDQDFGFRSRWGSASGTEVFRAHLFPMTTPALLWSREGARAFLALDVTWPFDHTLRQWCLSRRGGLGFDRPLVELGQSESLIGGRETQFTRAYLSRRRWRRRRERAHAAWNRLRWQLNRR